MKFRWISLAAAGMMALCLAMPIASNAAPEAGTPGTPPAGTTGKGKPGAGQPGKGKPGQRGGRAIQAALDKLSLTPEQKGKIDKLTEAKNAEVKKLREGSTDPKANREQARGIFKKYMEDVQAVLTAEQKEKLKTAMEEARKKRMAAGGAPKKPGTPKKPKPPTL